MRFLRLACFHAICIQKLLKVVVSYIIWVFHLFYMENGLIFSFIWFLEQGKYIVLTSVKILNMVIDRSLNWWLHTLLIHVFVFFVLSCCCFSFDQPILYHADISVYHQSEFTLYAVAVWPSCSMTLSFLCRVHLIQSKDRLGI